jgi:hypothetical protein
VPVEGVVENLRRKVSFSLLPRRVEILSHRVETIHQVAKLGDLDGRQNGWEIGEAILSHGLRLTLDATVVDEWQGLSHDHDHT